LLMVLTKNNVVAL